MSRTDASREKRTIVLPDARATRELGAALAAVARPGAILLLDGPLGAGKTTFVQGFCAAIGAAAAASPSFVLAHYYGGGRLPVWHLDLYRIEDEAAIDDLDLDQYLPRDGVALVEWPSRAPNRWPADNVAIEFSIEGTGRRAAISGHGAGVDAVRALALDHFVA